MVPMRTAMLVRAVVHVQTGRPFGWAGTGGLHENLALGAPLATPLATAAWRQWKAEPSSQPISTFRGQAGTSTAEVLSARMIAASTKGPAGETDLERRSPSSDTVFRQHTAARPGGLTRCVLRRGIARWRIAAAGDTRAGRRPALRTRRNRTPNGPGYPRFAPSCPFTGQFICLRRHFRIPAAGLVADPSTPSRRPGPLS